MTDRIENRRSAAVAANRPIKGREFGRRPERRDRGEASDGPVILYGWHTVVAALANPERTIRRLYLSENAAKRLADENIDTKVTPEIVRPALIDQRLGPDAVHQGLLAEADPLPSPDIDTLPQEGIVLVLDQITDPHNVGAILRSAAAFAVKAIVTTARHSPEATGVLAKSASGALELVPLVTVQNLARALTEMNDQGFLTVGLDSQGSENLGAVALAAAFGAGAGRGGQGPAAIDPRYLRRGGAARHARRNQEPECLERRGAGALYRRQPARPDGLNPIPKNNARSQSNANGRGWLPSNPAISSNGAACARDSRSDAACRDSRSACCNAAHSRGGLHIHSACPDDPNDSRYGRATGG